MSAKVVKPSATRTQKRSRHTRQRLQQAALDVFAEKGWDATTVEDITQKADLGKGTLYRHFSDKEEILVTLVDQAVDHLSKLLTERSAEIDTLEDVLEHYLTAHYEFYRENSEEFILLFQGRVLLKLQSESPGDLEEPYIRYLQTIEEEIRPYLSPRIDPLKIRRLACAVAGFIFGFFSFAMIGMEPDEIETSIKPLRRAFVRSLCTFLGRE
ncbi:MAG: TetR/AcrR family transcriptional regulator [Phycisphaerae bacterium]|nr:TetR/AcrR family transcriptional regulator [Phycisphaerae bacterium]